jgi:peptidoglycan/LPS O-acetylase OafA/YrhL
LSLQKQGIMGLLRFLLALSVLLVHSRTSVQLVDGQIAVQSFYIISGFYMSLILNEKYVKQNNSYKLFITNRFLRIFPLYWVILTIVVIISIAYHFHSNEQGHSGGVMAYYYSYTKNMNAFSFIFIVFTNIFLFCQDIIMFLGLDITSGKLFFTANFRNTNPQLHKFLFIPQAWTIGVELLFYVVAPFLVRRNIKVVLGIILISVILRVVLYSNGLQNDPWSYRFFPTEIALFLLGNVSYFIYKKIETKNINIVLLKAAFIFILLLTLLYNYLPIAERQLFYIISFFLLLPFIFQLTKKVKKDRYIGELSYPIYISHMLIIMMTHRFFLKNPYLGWFDIISTIALSILLNEFVSKRIENIREHRLRKAHIND